MKSKLEFKKMSKDELIELCHRDQCLQSTIEDKDKEITKIKNAEAIKFEKEKRTIVTAAEKEKEGLISQMGYIEHKSHIYLELAEKAMSRYKSLIKVLEGLTDTAAELLEYSEIILDTNKK